MDHIVKTPHELEALYPGVAKISPASFAKETAVINDAYRQLIEAAPFFTIATIGEEGMDCSPRGDAPGFVRVLDEKSVVFPDRRGNNRLDTLRNIVADPRVSLLFLIPGLNETFRINGRGFISTDPDLIESFKEQGKLPASVIIVEIDTMYFQCARALIRSKLWDAQAQVDRKSLPTAGQLVKSTMATFEADEYDKALPERQANTLY